LLLQVVSKLSLAMCQQTIQSPNIRRNTLSLNLSLPLPLHRHKPFFSPTTTYSFELSPISFYVVLAMKLINLIVVTANHTKSTAAAAVVTRSVRYSLIAQYTLWYDMLLYKSKITIWWFLRNYVIYYDLSFLPLLIGKPYAWVYCNRNLSLSCHNLCKYYSEIRVNILTHRYNCFTSVLGSIVVYIY